MKIKDSLFCQTFQNKRRYLVIGMQSVLRAFYSIHWRLTLVQLFLRETWPFIQAQNCCFNGPYNRTLRKKWYIFNATLINISVLYFKDDMTFNAIQSPLCRLAPITCLYFPINFIKTSVSLQILNCRHIVTQWWSLIFNTDLFLSLPSLNWNAMPTYTHPHTLILYLVRI